MLTAAMHQPIERYRQDSKRPRMPEAVAGESLSAMQTCMPHSGLLMPSWGWHVKETLEVKVKSKDAHHKQTCCQALECQYGMNSGTC